jgi:hypothetical protein
MPKEWDVDLSPLANTNLAQNKIHFLLLVSAVLQGI